MGTPTITVFDPGWGVDPNVGVEVLSGLFPPCVHAKVRITPWDDHHEFVVVVAILLGASLQAGELTRHLTDGLTGHL